MGQAILPRLVQSGAPVMVWNRTDKTKLIEAAGAIPASSPSEVVKNCDVVLSFLFDDAAVEAVYLGPSGLFSESCEGRTFIEMSTIKPRTIEAISCAALARRAAFVEAPVSGSTAAARAGSLLVLAGGAPDEICAVTPILNLFARRVVHMGPIGRGMAAKLGVQLLTYSYWLALGEAAAIASSSGLPIKEFLEVLADTPAALGALRGKLPAILGDEKDVAFSISAAQKDLEVIRDHARLLDVQGAMGESVFGQYGAAVRSGLGDDDIAAIVAFASKRPAHSQAQQRDITSENK